MEEIEIYFDDLNEEKQKEVLRVYQIESADDMNWDLIPLTTLMVSEEGEEIDGAVANLKSD